MARAALIALVLLVAGGGPAGAQSGADTFRLPSGAIYCAYEHYDTSPVDLRCEIRGGIKPTPANGCDDGYLLKETGPATSFCAADTIYDSNALVLAYGTTRQLGPFSCSSSAAGLRCANTSGNGFFMSKQRSRLLKGIVPRIGSFKTPSRNIVCGYSIDVHGLASMECGILSGLRPAPKRIHCDAGDPNDKRLSLSATGRARPVLCAGDPGPLLPQIQAQARVLPYGTTIRFGGISCASAFTGLTCRNRSGHGFFLSRERWRLF
jgi:hypothetical protein